MTPADVSDINILKQWQVRRGNMVLKIISYNIVILLLELFKSGEKVILIYLFLMLEDCCFKVAGMAVMYEE